MNSAATLHCNLADVLHHFEVTVILVHIVPQYFFCTVDDKLCCRYCENVTSSLGYGKYLNPFAQFPISIKLHLGHY